MAPPPSLLYRRNSGRFGVVIAAVVLPIAAWIAYNFWDRPLPPQAQAVLGAEPRQIPDADNLFLALLGFSLEGDEPAHERGRAALTAYDDLPADQRPGTYAEALGRNIAIFESGPARFCSLGNQAGAYACLQISREDREVLQAMTMHVAPLIQRYGELQTYPDYVDPRLPTQDQPAPDVGPLRIALLNLSVLTWMIDAGQGDRAMAELDRSASLWRRVLSATDVGLIEKTMAVRALAAHLMFASEWLRERPVGTDLPLDTLLAPLSAQELSLAEAMTQEFRLQAALWEQLSDPQNPVIRADFPDASAWWYPLLMKRNDTIHRSYEDLQSVLEVERAGCTEVRAQLARIKAQGASRGPAWYEYFYNPIGRVLHGMTGIGTQLVHLGRQCNLLALQQMVSLQRELHRRGVGRDSMAEQVRALAEQYTDPNSGGAFVYDAEAHTLGFEFLGPNQEFLTPMPLSSP